MKMMAMPRCLQTGDDLEQLVDFLPVEAGRRFIENQDLAGQFNGAGNGDNLLNGNGIGAKLGLHVDFQPVAGKKRAGVLFNQRLCG